MHEVCWKSKWVLDLHLFKVGVKGMVVDKNSKDFTSLLTTSDGIRSSKITSTCTNKVATCKRVIFKLVLLIILISLVVTTNCSPWSHPTIDDLTFVVLILILISIDTREGGSYLRYGKAIW
jgi:hypothetical protein